MKLESRTIEMTCSVIFTERETKMLGYLAGFGGEEIAERICNGLTKEFSREEWVKLWADFRGKLQWSAQHFAKTRDVFEGRKEVKL